MIVVFIPALLMEIFAIYFVIKTTSMNIPIHWYTILDFFFWSFFLITPTIVVIHIGAITAQAGKTLGDLAGKYSNNCNDETTFQRVRLSIGACTTLNNFSSFS